MPYNRNIFTIDFEKLAHWFTPVHWRKPKLLVWIFATCSTWSDLYARFQSYRSRVKYDLLITPQVCFLEKALNDRYDVALRRIYIDDAAEVLAFPLFLRNESKPVKLFRRSEDAEEIVLYRREETSAFGVDFVIFVPSDVPFNNSEIRAFVNRYKLLTKTYSIKIV